MDFLLKSFLFFSSQYELWGLVSSHSSLAWGVFGGLFFFLLFGVWCVGGGCWFFLVLVFVGWGSKLPVPLLFFHSHTGSSGSEPFSCQAFPAFGFLS